MYPSYQLPNNKRGLLIFDFDGVLADSFDTFYSLNKGSMKAVGVKLTKSAFKNLFNGNIHAGLKSLIKDKNSYKKFLSIRDERYSTYYPGEVNLFKGAVGLIKKLKTKYCLCIASSSLESAINFLLKKGGVNSCFVLVKGGQHYSKKDILNEILIKTKLKPQNAIMITDTIGDIKVSKKVGLKTIAVTWGFHSAKMLKLSEPNFIVNNFNELTNYLI